MTEWTTAIIESASWDGADLAMQVVTHTHSATLYPGPFARMMLTALGERSLRPESLTGQQIEIRVDDRQGGDHQGVYWCVRPKAERARYRSLVFFESARVARVRRKVA